MCMFVCVHMCIFVCACMYVTIEECIMTFITYLPIEVKPFAKDPAQQARYEAFLAGKRSKGD